MLHKFFYFVCLLCFSASVHSLSSMAERLPQACYKASKRLLRRTFASVSVQDLHADSTILYVNKPRRAAVSSAIEKARKMREQGAKFPTKVRLRHIGLHDLLPNVTINPRDQVALPDKIMAAGFDEVEIPYHGLLCASLLDHKKTVLVDTKKQFDDFVSEIQKRKSLQKSKEPYPSVSIHVSARTLTERFLSTFDWSKTPQEISDLSVRKAARLIQRASKQGIAVHTYCSNVFAYEKSIMNRHTLLKYVAAFQKHGPVHLKDSPGDTSDESVRETLKLLKHEGADISSLIGCFKQTDNGSEFINVLEFLATGGSALDVEFTTPADPEKNSVVSDIEAAVLLKMIGIQTGISLPKASMVNTWVNSMHRIASPQ